MFKIKEESKIRIEKFFKIRKLDRFIKLSKNSSKDLSTPYSKSLLKPNLKDLYFIYNLILKSKRITSLEIGCGYSSEIIALALNENKTKYQNQMKHLRRSHPFKNFVLDNQKKYLNILKKRSKYLKNIIFNYSECTVDIINNNYVLRYQKLPLISPDFIYIDGPSQDKIKNNIYHFNINDKDLMPIVSDILLIEYYLIPGTILLIDGRGANAHFLRDNFKRKWNYKYFKYYDMHYFQLNTNSIGPINEKQLRFFNNNN